MTKFSHLFALTGALAFVASTIPYTSISAQEISEGGSGYTGHHGAGGHEVVSSFEPGFTPPIIGTSSTKIDMKTASPAATAKITKAIEAAYAFCARSVQKEYMIDCLGSNLADLAAEIPKTGDYAEAAQILADAATKLRTIARDNRSATLPKARLKGIVDDVEVTTKRLIPVETSSLSTSAALAADVLEETQTLLLRSAENSERRKIPYEEIALAVGSQKVLLRSL
ncbi:MAG: hypothetical protein ACJAR9_000024 [Celeribacter sp.]|jgi:hypothetical protein